MSGDPSRVGLSRWLSPRLINWEPIRGQSTLTWWHMRGSDTLRAALVFTRPAVSPQRLQQVLLFTCSLASNFIWGTLLEENKLKRRCSCQNFICAAAVHVPRAEPNTTHSTANLFFCVNKRGLRALSFQFPGKCAREYQID